MRLIFLGTPDFAVPSLKKIAETHHQIIAVVTQPDKPRNRGKVTPSPVKEAALGLGIPVLQYDKISREGVDDIKNLAPDIMVTCAYGQILSKEILAIPKYGVINEHASLLPKYRGSSPIQWCVINGEKQTGVTIMKTAYEVDSGDILFSDITQISDEETAGELFERLSILAADSIVKALDMIENGNARFVPQNAKDATFCKMLSKSDGLIDWTKTAEQIKNFVRGMNPWPSAYTNLNGQTFKIHKVSVIDKVAKGEAGEIVFVDKNSIAVACGDGVVNLEILQAQNAKKMTVKDYLLGHKVQVGDKFGTD